jgi:anion-transporting  ArsA/GET3 family ATPase
MKRVLQPKLIALLAAVALVGACSAIKLGYNNSASFAHTYITSKVDFDSEQSALLKTSLIEIVQWHRNAELPVLASELQTARQALAPRNGVLMPVNANQVQALNQAIRASLRRTANEAAPVIAKNMLGLWPNQIHDIQKALDKSNTEYREERLMLSPERRVRESAERMEERFERWLGTLNPVQVKQIEAWAKAENHRAESRYEKRLQRQQQFMALVNKAANRQIEQVTLSQEIANLLNAWQNPASAAEKQESEQRQKATIALIVDVLNSATAEQRNNAADRAAGWAKDFQILASNK